MAKLYKIVLPHKRVLCMAHI